MRLVGKPMEVYQYLEPLYNDYRKVRRALPRGSAACSPFLNPNSRSFMLLSCTRLLHVSASFRLHSSNQRFEPCLLANQTVSSVRVLEPHAID